MCLITERGINGVFTRCMISRMVRAIIWKESRILSVRWSSKYTARYTIGFWINWLTRSIVPVRLNLPVVIWVTRWWVNAVCWNLFKKGSWPVGMIPVCRRLPGWDVPGIRPNLSVILRRRWELPVGRSWWTWLYWNSVFGSIWTRLPPAWWPCWIRFGWW